MASMNEETTREFLQRLWQAQDDAGVSNAELARRLECDASYITHLRLGRRDYPKLGAAFVLNAARHFPDLRSFLLPAELLVGNTSVPTNHGGTEQ